MTRGVSKSGESAKIIAMKIKDKQLSKNTMKKAVIILIAIALIAGACGQATKQVKDNATRQYAGTYTFGGKDSETHSGIVYIYPETDSALLFYLFVIKGAPSYNSGSIVGRMTLHNGKATFQKRFEYEETNCVLRFEFNENMLTVTEDENDCGCGFGHGVYVDDTFQRITSEIPQYYTTVEDEKVYFSEWQED